MINSFNTFLQYIDSEYPKNDWNPFLFKIDQAESSEFDSLIKNRNFSIHDHLEEQLNELARIKFPSNLDLEKREQYVSERYGEFDASNCIGNWAFLSWKNTLVHLLSEIEYLQVITNRNHNKITVNDQKIMRQMKVGVIGLSVGAEAAVTIAQENLCGEMRIADFDTLDLSNLNRICAGFDEIGLPKTVVTARKIKCMNPYMDLKLFDNGVNEESMDSFLFNLDLIIEECDGLEFKYKVRSEAKKRKINLLSAADEKGFFSIEPYQLDDRLEVFHGLIKNTPKPKEEYASEQEFIISLCDWIGGWENISEESRDSVLKIGKEFCGYPQLAGEARLAAAQVAFFARRLLLGEKLPSQYFTVDLDSFVNNNSLKNNVM